MSNITATIEQTVRDNGYGQYLPRLNGVVADIEVRMSRGEAPLQAVEGALRASGNQSYSFYAGPVVRALEALQPEQVAAPVEAETGDEGFDREYAAQVIRQAAETEGLNPEVVESVLVQAGLVDEPEEEPEEENFSDEDDVLALLRSIDERINGLTEFARANGYRG